MRLTAASCHFWQGSACAILFWCSCTHGHVWNGTRYYYNYCMCLMSIVSHFMPIAVIELYEYRKNLTTIVNILCLSYIFYDYRLFSSVYKYVTYCWPLLNFWFLSLKEFISLSIIWNRSVEKHIALCSV